MLFGSNDDDVLKVVVRGKTMKVRIPKEFKEDPTEFIVVLAGGTYRVVRLLDGEFRWEKLPDDLLADSASALVAIVVHILGHVMEFGEVETLIAIAAAQEAISRVVRERKRKAA